MRYIVIPVVLYSLFCPVLLPAEECPPISSYMEHELEEKYPGFIIADDQSFAGGDSAQPAGPSETPCFHVVRIASSSYAIRLKKYSANYYKVVLAETLVHSHMSGWSFFPVDDFGEDLPLLGVVRAGMYLDIDTGRNFIVTRNCQAFKIELAGSGQVYIYKCVGEGDIEKFRVK